MGSRRSAWRGLGLFWAAVLVAVAVGAITLQRLGPLPHPHPEAAHAPAPTPVAEHSPQPERLSGVARPDPALLERSRDSALLMLPVIGPDGRRASTVYAAPPPVPPPAASGLKRIALVVGGFGQSERDSRAALAALPGPVTLSVSAYAAATAGPLIDAARTAGHELLAAIPMEPEGYPLNDEGTQSLMTGLPPEQNRRNLEWALGQLPGAVGATSASDGMRGERFAALSAAFDPILDEILRRGLLYLDARPGAPVRQDVPIRSVDVVLDDSQARAEIEARLAALERVAREKGAAIGLAGQLRPVTIERLSAWIAGLPARGLALVPVSSLLETPK